MCQLQKLGNKKYSALGWSQGGVTGVHLAALFPENIEKLVVFGTFACIDDKVMNNKRKCQIFINRALLGVGVVL